MQLICLVNTWVIPVKDKKEPVLLMHLKKSSQKKRKPNKIWIDQGSEFYNKSFKYFFKKNNIGIYSIYNEGKSVVAERFIRTLKSKIL